MKLTNYILKSNVNGLSSELIDETAVLSYTHWNPVMRWIFWKRIWIVQSLFCSIKKDIILDYGTGTGIMLPFLSGIANTVIALDKETIPAERLIKKMNLKNIKIYKVDTTPIPLGDEEADIVFCLDVLEHVNDISVVIKELLRVLKQGGRLIVSGPSENMIYKIGRFFAGFSKKARYHNTDILQIHNIVSKYFKVITKKRLFNCVRLFDINVYEK